MTLSRTPLGPALFVVCLAAASAPGCGDDLRVAPQVKRDLTKADNAHPIDIPLRPRALETQADFDALEEQYLGTLGQERLIQVYEALARDAKGKTESEAILIQRLTMLHLGASRGSERLQKVFAWADKLRAANPQGPHALYLLAHIKRILLQVSTGDGTFRLDDRNKDIADKLLEDWDSLLKVAPNYVGPNEVSAADLRKDRDRLARVLATMAATTTPSEVKGTRRDASDGERQARTDLWRFEHGSNAERSTMCAERDDRSDAGGRSELEQWIDLRCAVVQGRPEVAFKLLNALGDKVSQTSRCALMTPLTKTASRWGRALPDGLKTMAEACTKKAPSQPKPTP